MSPAWTGLHGLVVPHRLHCLPVVALRYLHPLHIALPNALKHMAPAVLMICPVSVGDMNHDSPLV
eukprot:9502542-Heterocapsa_arctica.AAC.1